MRAWKQMGPPSDWELVIAGPDEKGHTDELRREMRQLALDGVVRFVGPVDDDDKWTLYQSAELFVLPSLSENFGIVVAEALSAGVPVVTTTGTPWSVLREKEIGWCVEPEVDSLATALASATQMRTCDLREMGQRGSNWVRSEFQWDAIAQQMCQFYDWLDGGGAKPEFVV
jgi:glycosyltransferase involved in cell wall biosynthesis